MFTSPYFPHALYSVAITSISIHLVGKKRSIEDERARISAQTSILESIKAQLQSDKSLSNDELGRLKKLARPPPSDEATKKEAIGWKEIIFGGRKKEGDELSDWDKKDLAKMQSAMDKTS
ncbi:hypothetical protein BDQ12DRAFT_621724 [Crucibulum laeve]|uniref:Uncharacterized protein n=1 Tax=Crucibulum laeve TaxID=68775 RepID=A0A5C3MIC5_9AGAR|nr:hypothetical protein BDQ12DRAFT_621724 [Crucibulum laeve]